MKSVAILLFVCMLVSCTRQNSTKEEFEYIDIKLEQSKNSVNLSDIVDSIDYVSLETIENICNTLNCNVDDILEFTTEEEE